MDIVVMFAVEFIVCQFHWLVRLYKNRGTTWL